MVDPERMASAQGAVGRQPAPAREPQRQMAARGMAHRDNPVQIERIVFGEHRKLIRCLRGIGEGTRVAAAAAIDAAIVDVPDRDPAVAQVVGDPVHQPPIGDARLPATAMDHQHDRERPLACRQPQVADLQRIGAVGDGGTGLWVRAVGEVGPRQARRCGGDEAHGGDRQQQGGKIGEAHAARVAKAATSRHGRRLIVSAALLSMFPVWPPIFRNRRSACSMRRSIRHCRSAIWSTRCRRSPRGRCPMCATG